MAEQDRIEQLDAAIDAMLNGRAATGVEAETADLLTIASALREVAHPQFKAQTKWTVVPRVRHTVVPHCRVQGVPAFIDFLENAFGAIEEFRAPMPDGSIAHAEVRIGDSMVEMGDAGNNPPTSGAVHLYVDNVDELYEAHTVTTDPGQSVRFDSDFLLPDESFQFTFTERGRYLYYCRAHGGPATRRPRWGARRVFNTRGGG